MWTYARDPDIAGPGVIFGFILAGGLTLAASIATILLRRLQKTRNQRRSEITPCQHHNLADLWTDILETFVLGLSDQQLITGLLVLIVAYTKYLPQYNFNFFIAGDLVFFSNITHAATLTTLRSDLRRQGKLKWCRIALAYLTSLLWVVQACIYLAFFPSLRHSSPVPARLAFYAEIIQIIGIIWINFVVLLPLFLSERAIMLREALRPSSQVGCPDIEACIGIIEDVWRKNPRGGLGRGFARFYIRLCQRYIRQKPRILRVAMWITLEVVFPWYTTILILVGLFALALVYLVVDVQDGGIANEWGFGQLLPIFMILLPMFTIFETYVERQQHQGKFESRASQTINDSSEMRSIVQLKRKPSSVNFPASPTSVNHNLLSDTQRVCPQSPIHTESTPFLPHVPPEEAHRPPNTVAANQNGDVSPLSSACEATLTDETIPPDILAAEPAAN